MKSSILIITAIAALSLSACKQTEAPAAGTDTATPAADAAVVTDTVQAGTGVAECDQYLEKVYACISDKVPEAQRDMMKQGIEQSKVAWASVSDKTELANQCKTAMEQAKASFGAMGCTF